MRDIAEILENYADEKRVAKIAWTEERVERLKKLIEEGLTAGQVSREMGGHTRNAIIGKAARLGFNFARSSGSRSPEARAAQKSARQKYIKRGLDTQRGTGRIKAPVIFDGKTIKTNQDAHNRAMVISDTAPAALMVSLLDLEPHHCRWPIGDPKAKTGFGFCGCRKAPVGSYCPEHTQMARRKSDVSGEPISSFYGHRRVA